MGADLILGALSPLRFYPQGVSSVTTTTPPRTAAPSERPRTVRPRRETDHRTAIDRAGHHRDPTLAEYGGMGHPAAFRRARQQPQTPRRDHSPTLGRAVPEGVSRLCTERRWSTCGRGRRFRPITTAGPPVRLAPAVARCRGEADLRRANPPLTPFPVDNPKAEPHRRRAVREACLPVRRGVESGDGAGLAA